MKPDFDTALEQQLTERQLRKIQSGGKVERIFSRKQIEQAFIESFELIGGVPRLALWANQEENYGEFLKLLMKLAPKEAAANLGNTINFVSSIPHSPLTDRKEVTEDGVIIVSEALRVESGKDADDID